jgi:imidazolonepropionase-like amidohydrolase
MSKATLLKAHRAIDGTGSETMHDVQVLVVGDRIKHIGKAESFEVPSDASTIDLGDTTLVPGLIDCHSHVSMSGSLKDYRGRMLDPLPLLAMRAVKNLEKDIMGGVTSIRCLGDKGFVSTNAARAVRSGMILGPTIVASGLGIRTSVAHGHVATVFDGCEDIRKAIRQNILEGAELTKIFVTGDPRGGDDAPFAMSLDEIRAAVDESHRLGVPVAAHCGGGPAFGACVENGVDFIEHSFYVTDHDIERAARSKSTVGFTVNTVFNPARVANRYFGPVPEKETIKQEVIKKNWRKFIDAGVPFLVGTDAQHGELLWDLKFVIRELGVPVLQAIRKVTQDAATALGLSEVGLLAEGYRADIVGLAGQIIPSPDEGLNVCFVMKDGCTVRR